MTCSHCGLTHPPDQEKCPQTGELMSVVGPIGTRIDRYQVESLIGSGGFGGVYRASHVLAGHKVALKLLHRQLARDASMLDRLMREARSAAAIGSPHIVRVLDCGVTAEGQGFIAMELLSGVDLKELSRRERPMLVRRAVELVLQALEGLGAAHKAGVVHRDIKPANLFVTTDEGKERVKLLDFGVSKARAANEISDLTMPGTAMGTPAYMAPEQHSNARDVDARADLYSMAVVLYELLAGRPPFDAKSFADLIVQVRTQQPPKLHDLLPGIGPALADAIEKGLAREADHRWRTAEEFAAALRAALGDTSNLLMSATFSPLLRGNSATPRSTAPMPAVIATPVPPSSSRAGGVLAVLGALALGVGLTLMWTQRAPAVVGVNPEPLVTRELAPVAMPVQVEPEPVDPPLLEAAPFEVPEEAPPPRPKQPRRPMARGGVVIHEPSYLGTMEHPPVAALLKLAKPAMEECRSDVDAHVTIQVFVNEDGRLPIVQPSAIIPNQNQEVARCIANRVKAAKPKDWLPGGDGIVSFEADVPRR